MRMALIRANCPLQLASLSLGRAAQTRFISSSSRASVLQVPIKYGGKMQRYVPEEARNFVLPNGKLLTTQENIDFFKHHPTLDFDSSKLMRLADPDLKRSTHRYNTTISYSPLHIIHPHDLKYLDPRGHPRITRLQDLYERKLREEALWIITTAASPASAIVRSLTQRKLKAAVYQALEARGYKSGYRADREIRGTVWLFVHDPIVAAAHSPDDFGEALASFLDKRLSKPTGRDINTQ